MKYDNESKKSPELEQAIREITESTQTDENRDFQSILRPSLLCGLR